MSKIKYTQKDFECEVYKVHPHIEIIGKYSKQKNKVKWRCRKCGFVTETQASCLLNPKLLYTCNTHKNSLLPRTEWTAQRKKNGYNKLVNFLHNTAPHLVLPNGIEEYDTIDTTVTVYCKKCQRKWKTTPGHLLKGQGCSLCKKGFRTSYVEEFILLSFKKLLNVPVLSRYSPCSDISELDVYIPSLNFAIEPGSWKWHQEHYERDLGKQIICKQHGIRLIIIYYDKAPQEQKYPKDVYAFNESLRDNTAKLQEITQFLLREAGYSGLISSVQWEEIRTEVAKTNHNIKKLQQSQQAAYLLSTTILTASEIGQRVGLSIPTVYSINKGTYLRFKEYKYPIRNNELSCIIDMEIARIDEDNNIIEYKNLNQCVEYLLNREINNIKQKNKNAIARNIAKATITGKICYGNYWRRIK